MLSILFKRNTFSQMGSFEQKNTQSAHAPSYIKNEPSEAKSLKKRNETEWRDIMAQRNYFLKAL